MIKKKKKKREREERKNKIAKNSSFFANRDKSACQEITNNFLISADRRRGKQRVKKRATLKSVNQRRNIESLKETKQISNRKKINISAVERKRQGEEDK